MSVVRGEFRANAEGGAGLGGIDYFLFSPVVYHNGDPNQKPPSQPILAQQSMAKLEAGIRPSS